MARYHIATTEVTSDRLPASSSPAGWPKAKNPRGSRGLVRQLLPTRNSEEPNTAGDDDTDGDGVSNGEDQDVDGDGAQNGNDDDVDGDNVPNGADNDVEGDGAANQDDQDVDGDGAVNEDDDDVDGDGLPNGADNDVDGDGDPDTTDPQPDGPGGGGHSSATWRIVVKQVLFADSGPLRAWSDGSVLSPPPASTHWDAEQGGPLFPVVYGFTDWPDLLITFDIVGAPAERMLYVRALMNGVAVAQGGEVLATLQSPVERGMVLTGTASIPGANSVSASTQPVVTIQYSMDGQSWSDAATVRPTRWYFMPEQVQGSQAHPVYDLALEQLVQYAGGLSSLEDIAIDCNFEMSQEIWYEPAQAAREGRPVPLVLYSLLTAGCEDHSALFEYLLGCAGIRTEARYLWSGGAEGTPADFARVLYCVGSTVGRPGGTAIATFQVARPPHDGAVPDPHFSYHAVVRTSAGVFDPSYGLVGVPTVLELAPPCCIQQDGTVDCGQPVGCLLSVNPQLRESPDLGARAQIPCDQPACWCPH